MKRRPHRVGHQAVGELLSSLLIGSMSVTELAATSGLHRLVVGQMLCAWRASKAAHISEWGLDRYGRHNVALWSIGHKADAPRPMKATQAAVNKRQRQLRARKALIDQLSLRAKPTLPPVTETNHETV